MIEVLHCEDVLSDDDPTTFKEYADDRISPPDQVVLTLIHGAVKKATKRHSIRLTSAEVSFALQVTFKLK